MMQNPPDTLSPPIATPVHEAAHEQDDPFYYGTRVEVVYDAQGTPTYTEKPLSPDDFLDPQEGDEFVQGTVHENNVHDTKTIFRSLYHHDETTGVFCDLKMCWGIAGLSEPCPDVAVVPHVRNLGEPRGAFDVLAEGTRPHFVLEIVSPRYRTKDLNEKVAIYEAAGVMEYVIIDSVFDDENIPRYTVLGYYLKRGSYVPIAPDERGYIYSATNDVWIGVSAERERFFVLDAQTNEEILPDRLRVEAEHQRAEAEHQRAETERQRAEAEHQRAEVAEQRTEQEHQRAEAAEQRQREMEAELMRLREELARKGEHP
jgi:hypothetical protein